MGVFVCEYANEKTWVWPPLWVSRSVCVFVRNRLLSSCQPLEIPGNVIQSCSLKNHSARNSPGQQRQQDSLWWEDNFKACANTNNQCHSRPLASPPPLMLNVATMLLPCDLCTHIYTCMGKTQLSQLVWCVTSMSFTGHSHCSCMCVGWFSSTPRLHVASYKNSISMTE